MKRSKIIAASGMAALLLLSGCGGNQDVGEAEYASGTEDQDTVSWDGLSKTGSLEVLYATQFQADYYEGGYTYLTVADANSYLVVPEEAPVPQDLPKDTCVLQQPFDNIYLVATSAMDLFRALDGVGNVRLSGLQADAWYIEEAKKAMEDGEMLYAGKYSTPDYELILSEDCDLAVESTMIYHSPEVAEELQTLGIPVFVEHSSYESHPLGRMEWIKAYGVLLGKEQEAQTFFEEQTKQLAEVSGQENNGKTVAFFYITSNGAVNIHKPGSYIAKMIELAGGSYVFAGLEGEENALTTMNMQMEDFYTVAKDADYLIYNSTIEGELGSLEQFLEKSELFESFRAVQNGNVWCVQKNLFQESTGLGDMIVDIHTMLTQETPSEDGMNYLYRLQ